MNEIINSGIGRKTTQLSKLCLFIYTMYMYVLIHCKGYHWVGFYREVLDF